MQNFSEFLHMGGYGAYVWSSFGLSFITLLFNFVLPVIQERKTLEGIRKRVKKDEQSK